MTSWRYVTCLFLFVFLSMVDLSEGCNDYFSLSKWGANLTDTMSLVITDDPKDIMECTVERECLERRKNYCYWLMDCLDRDIPKEKSAKCKGNEDEQKVSFYHFMCMAAKAFTDSPPPEVIKACEFDTACQLYPKIPFYTEATTTATTLPPTTTTTKPPATKQPTTTTAATTTTTTTKTTVLPPTTTAKTEPTATQSADSGSNDKQSEDKDEDKTYTFMHSVLMVSLSLNVILPLAVFLFMRQRLKLHRRQNNNNLTYMSNGHLLSSSSVVEVEPNVQLASADKDKVESSLLMQPQECHSVHKEDTKRNCSAVREETTL